MPLDVFIVACKFCANWVACSIDIDILRVTRNFFESNGNSSSHTEIIRVNGIVSPHYLPPELLDCWEYSLRSSKASQRSESNEPSRTNVVKTSCKRREHVVKTSRTRCESVFENVVNTSWTRRENVVKASLPPRENVAPSRYLAIRPSPYLAIWPSRYLAILRLAILPPLVSLSCHPSSCSLAIARLVILPSASLVLFAQVNFAWGVWGFRAANNSSFLKRPRTVFESMAAGSFATSWTHPCSDRMLFSSTTGSC